MSPVRAIAALVRLDLRVWIGMRAAIVAALVPPAGMALLLVAMTLAVGRQPIALVNESRYGRGEKMRRNLTADEEAYLVTETDRAQALDMLRDQRVAAIVTIPADFDQKVSDRAGSLRLELNNIDIDFADDIRRSVERSVAEFEAPGLGFAAESGDEDAGSMKIHGYRKNNFHVAIHESDLRKTNVDFLSYQVLPVLVLLVLNVGLMGAALLCAADRQRGTARMLLLLPVDSAWLVAGRILSGWIVSIAALAVALLFCVAGRIAGPPPGHWPALLLLFGLTGLSASGLGAMLGTTIREQKDLAMMTLVLATCLFFLGGGFTTIAYLPRSVQLVSAADPIRYAIDGMRQALFYPDLAGVSRDATVLAITAAVCGLIGCRRLLSTWRE
jgi:ABC-type multidrug transport system permease subunit